MPLPNTGEIIEARGMRAGYTAQQKADQMWLDEKHKMLTNASEVTKRTTSHVPKWRKGQVGLYTSDA